MSTQGAPPLLLLPEDDVLLPLPEDDVLLPLPEDDVLLPLPEDDVLLPLPEDDVLLPLPEDEVLLPEDDVLLPEDDVLLLLVSPLDDDVLLLVPLDDDVLLLVSPPLEDDVLAPLEDEVLLLASAPLDDDVLAPLEVAPASVSAPLDDVLLDDDVLLAPPDDVEDDVPVAPDELLPGAAKPGSTGAGLPAPVSVPQPAANNRSAAVTIIGCLLYSMATPRRFRSHLPSRKCQRIDAPISYAMQRRGAIEFTL